LTVQLPENSMTSYSDINNQSMILIVPKVGIHGYQRRKNL